MRWAYYTTKNKIIQHRLDFDKKGYTIVTMNTLNTLTNSILQVINEEIIEDLIDLGFDHSEAIKVVTEFDNFDLVMDSSENPVIDFWLN